MADPKQPAFPGASAMQTGATFHEPDAAQCMAVLNRLTSILLEAERAVLGHDAEAIASAIERREIVAKERARIVSALCEQANRANANGDTEIADALDTFASRLVGGEIDNG